MNARLLLLVGLLALWPISASAQEPPLRRLAEATSTCMTTMLIGQIIGMAWVEPTSDGYRVVTSKAYPPPWEGDVYGWIDLTRTPADPNAIIPLNDPNDPYHYLLPTHHFDYHAAHGEHRDETIALVGHDCVRWSLHGR